MVMKKETPDVVSPPKKKSKLADFIRDRQAKRKTTYGGSPSYSKYSSYGAYDESDDLADLAKNSLFGGYKQKSLSTVWSYPWTRNSSSGDDPRIIKTEADGKKILKDVNVSIMAKHLKTIRSTVRIVFGKGAIAVNWATEDVSMTNIETGDIRLSPYPLLSVEERHNDFSMEDRRDAIHGLALHEAAHNKYTPAQSKRDAQDIGGDIFAEFFNIFEDCYIEYEVANEYPGFAGYFNAFRNFYHTEDYVKKTIEQILEDDLSTIGQNPGNKNDPARTEELTEYLAHVINALIPYINYRGDIQPLRDKGGNWEKVAQILDRARNNADAIRSVGCDIQSRYQAAQQTLLDLVAFFSEIPPEEMNKDSFKDRLDQMARSGLMDALEKMMQELGVGNSSGVVPKVDQTGEQANAAARGHARGDLLSLENGAKVNALNDANFEEIEQESMRRGSDEPYQERITRIDMKRIPYADKRYADLSRDVAKAERKLMNVLKFRSEDRIYKERERDNGRVDATRLVNLKAFNSRDIFYQNIKAEAPKVHIGILVDESGSMRSATRSYYDSRANVRKMDTAVQTAIMMTNALSKTQGTSYEVWGHTGEAHSHWPVTSLDTECAGPVEGVRFDGCLLMRYVDSLKGITDNRVLGRIAARGNNYDGPAIQYVAKHMMENVPVGRKVMFVLCDGMPCGYGYGGNAVEDTARRVQAARKAGVEVISIFIGELSGAEEQMVRMYGQKGKGWYPCPDAEKLPMVAEKIAASILKWEG